MHKFKNITAKIIGVALATTLLIGGVTVMAADNGNISCDTTYTVQLTDSDDGFYNIYHFTPPH